MSPDPAASSLLSVDNPLMPRLYQAAVGALRTDYYQQQFERFDTLGKPLPSWNWAAGCCTLGWMALRGLWRHAAVYAAALLGVIVLWWALGLHQLLPLPVSLALALLLVLMAVLLPGLWGNAIYHRVVRERTMQALTQSNTLAEAMEQLQAQAPNPSRLQWATTGQIVSGLMLAAVMWSLGSAPAPRANVSPPATGLTQQDTARALAALMPAASQPAGTGEKAPLSVSETTTPVQPQIHAIESIALEMPDMPALTLAPAAPVASQAETPPLATQAIQAVTAPAPIQAAAAADPSNLGSPSVQVAESAKKSGPANSSTRKTTGTEKATATRAAKEEKTAGKRAVVAPKTSLQPGKYYLNSGIYAQPDNAKRVENQLRTAGQPVFTQTLESSKGPVTRVRVGPFNSRTQAQAAASKIQSLKLEAQLFRHAPNP